MRYTQNKRLKSKYNLKIVQEIQSERKKENKTQKKKKKIEKKR